MFFKIAISSSLIQRKIVEVNMIYLEWRTSKNDGTYSELLLENWKNRWAVELLPECATIILHTKAQVV